MGAPQQGKKSRSTGRSWTLEKELLRTYVRMMKMNFAGLPFPWSFVSLLSSPAEEHRPIIPKNANLPEPSRLQALFLCMCCCMDVYNSASQSHCDQTSGHSNPVFYSTISYRVDQALCSFYTMSSQASPSSVALCLGKNNSHSRWKSL